MKTNLYFRAAVFLLFSTAAVAAQTPLSLKSIAPGPVNSSTEISCQYTGSESEIDSIFLSAVSKLKNINRWGRHILPPGQKFRLLSPSGAPMTAPAVGNFIQIYPAFLLTGFRQFSAELSEAAEISPQTLSRAVKQISKSYFWVQIEDIQESYGASHQEFQMTVRPSANPLRRDQPHLIRHMFNSTATNSFSMRRDGRQISVSVVGKHEEINLSEGLNPEEKLIHAVGAITSWGALENSNIGTTAGIGLQKAIWTSLLWSLLPKNTDCALDGKTIPKN